MAVRLALFALVAVSGLSCALAYPRFWAEEYAPNCQALPTGPKDGHKAPVADRMTAITVLDGQGKAVNRVCAGRQYRVRVRFPQARLAFVSLSGGPGVRVAQQSQGVASRRCPNAMVFTRTPATQHEGFGVAPSNAGRWTIAVASATGSTSPFYTARTSVTVARC